ncbi:MAG TPA: metalloregulator ArsR/SmtB family transcription factor [Candidatus Eisenbacteria bacterium]|jgi:DNA-binding transcriptional ArsR family regulator|nr:metalloregulator ArsR/SmtB family transcription factor [Candidatus Eisenbacteria bacterium]
MGRRRKAPIVDPDLARFIAVAEPSRWAMVGLLRERPRSVQEVAREVGLSLPVTSRHLQRMRAAGIVTAERRGKTLLCALSSPDTAGGGWLERAFGSAGAAVAIAATRRVTVRRPKAAPKLEPVTAEPLSRAVDPTPAVRPTLPRRELDDYLL